MKQYKVYKYTFPDGTTYIGTTSDTIQNRRNCGYQHNAILKDAISRFGWKNTKTEILADMLSMEEAFQKEKECIAIEKKLNPNKNANISLGGKSTFEGLRHTAEYKRRMSELCKGRHFTKETLQKMRDSHFMQKKPVERYDSEKSFICTYESLGDAAADVCGYKANIGRACKSGMAYKGSFWVFAKGGGLG